MKTLPRVRRACKRPNSPFVFIGLKKYLIDSIMSVFEIRKKGYITPPYVTVWKGEWHYEKVS